MSPRHAPSIIEFVTDPQLLGLAISRAQQVLLRSIYGLPLVNEAQHALWRACTGRETYTPRSYGEISVVAGARSGKDSRVAATTVLYEALFAGHERHVAKGETGTIVLVAQDAKAVGVAFGYITAYLQRSPVLAGLLDGEPLASSLRLRNGLVVQCFPCTLRSMRGYSIPVGVMDELAFYRIEGSADSDVEIQASIRRGMIAFPRTKLLKISTPYLRSGILHDDFKRAFGQDDPDLLVWKASTVLMNPSISEARLDRERRLDPTRFSREYEAEFAEDLETFLPSAWIEGAVVLGRRELPPDNQVRYVAACDPSGGGPDAFTLSIVHAEGQGAGRRVIQDVMRSWSKPRTGPMDLEGVVSEIADVLSRYFLTSVTGDKYAGAWVRESFRRHRVRYDEPTIRKDGDLVALDKSGAYLELEAAFAQGAIHILDHPQLLRELKNLERRHRVGGKPLIDHPSGGHDDHANSLALAVAACASRSTPFARAAILDGIASVGRDRAQVGDTVPAARPGGQLARGAIVGGQAAKLHRFFNP